MKHMILFCLTLFSTSAIAGPLSKFEAKSPVAEYRSSAKMEDIERCLSDMDNQPVPIAFRQPDRPDEVKLLWVQPSGVGARIDLKRQESGTMVKSWMGAKQARDCAPLAILP